MFSVTDVLDGVFRGDVAVLMKDEIIRLLSLVNAICCIFSLEIMFP